MTGKNNFKGLMVPAIISTLFSILGNIAVFTMTSKTGSLEYDISPISYFKLDSIQLSILNIKILNSGQKECEDIDLNVDFGSKISANDFSIAKSPESIITNQKLDSATGKILYSIPYLNPNEQVVYSFLFNKILDQKNLHVDLRGKGVNGVKTEVIDSSLASIFVVGTLVITFIAIYLLFIIVFHQQKVIKSYLKLEKVGKL
ncbi:MAG: hypothetical protein ABI359_09780 [Ginsengibacter sp.]